MSIFFPSESATRSERGRPASARSTIKKILIVKRWYMRHTKIIGRKPKWPIIRISPVASCFLFFFSYFLERGGKGWVAKKDREMCKSQVDWQDSSSGKLLRIFFWPFVEKGEIVSACGCVNAPLTWGRHSSNETKWPQPVPASSSIILAYGEALSKFTVVTFYTFHLDAVARAKGQTKRRKNTKKKKKKISS